MGKIFWSHLNTANCASSRYLYRKDSCYFSVVIQQQNYFALRKNFVATPQLPNKLPHDNLPVRGPGVTIPCSFPIRSILHPGNPHHLARVYGRALAMSTCSAALTCRAVMFILQNSTFKVKGSLLCFATIAYVTSCWVQILP
jgi:hypothetical protein